MNILCTQFLCLFFVIAISCCCNNLSPSLFTGCFIRNFHICIVYCLPFSCFMCSNTWWMFNLMWFFSQRFGFGYVCVCVLLIITRLLLALTHNDTISWTHSRHSDRNPCSSLPQGAIQLLSLTHSLFLSLSDTHTYTHTRSVSLSAGYFSSLTFSCPQHCSSLTF